MDVATIKRLEHSNIASRNQTLPAVLLNVAATPQREPVGPRGPCGPTGPKMPAGPRGP